MAKRKRDLSVVIPPKSPGYKAIHDDDYTLTEKTLIDIMVKEYVEFRQIDCDCSVIYTSVISSIAYSLMYNRQYPTFENIRNIVFNKLI